MIEDILIGVPWGFILSFMPGAVFFVLLETSVVKGFRSAIAFNFGVISADIVFILIAYYSSYRLIQSIKDDPALFIFGGLIMLTYGIISLLKQNKASKAIIIDDAAKEIIKKNYVSLFIKGFLLNFINVGVLGFWLTIIITTGPKLDMEPSRMLTFFIAVISAYFITDIFKILLAKQLRSKLTTKNIGKIKKGISIVLIIFGTALLVQGLFPAERKIMNSAIDKLEQEGKDKK
jgi:threonine/homoserine/homoserine lactone efflux protein